MIGGTQAKPAVKASTTAQILQSKRTSKLAEEEEKHTQSIAEMGDFERFHRNSKKAERVRVPVLTDE